MVLFNHPMLNYSTPNEYLYLAQCPFQNVYVDNSCYVHSCLY